MSGPVLNLPMVLEARVRTPDGAGGFAETWEAQGTLWCALQTASGREGEGDFANLSRARYRIVCRGAPEGAASRPKAGQRFTLGARAFAIQAVQEVDPLAKHLICHVEEEVAT
ncbi:MAG: head-tail adaptor protein [Shimia sp.]